MLAARYLLGSNDDIRPLLDLLTDADIEQSTIVLQRTLGHYRQGPAASIVRDAAAIRQALTQAKERNELVGRHADEDLKELAKRLGASPN